MNYMENFGNRLAECRQNKHMTQEELARRIAVTPQALSKWERSQSFPDLLILTDLCRILEVSADYLLGITGYPINENGDANLQGEICNSLRNSLEPLELILGESLIPAFTDNQFVELVFSLRKKLAKEGWLLPIVRIRDDLSLPPEEFRVLAYRKILYTAQVNTADQQLCSSVIEQLGEVVCANYADILSRDLVKVLVENLKIKYPVLISETIPIRISYGLLTDVLKELASRKISMVYLTKIIEYLDSLLRDSPDLRVSELAEQITKQFDRC